ncbi:type IV pilus twitching motility protein PilT, partial [Desulfofundulus sp.]|uniref:type IV pilus twitching motility protein PilT n=1 Tax=Desulfofundulus sp. TaxID=2282750 RepID=UPI003C73296C
MAGGIETLLRLVVDAGASDLHITVGVPPVIRLHGRLRKLPELVSGLPDVEPQVVKKVQEFLTAHPDWSRPLTPELTGSLADELLKSERHRRRYEDKGAADLAYSLPGVSRFRLNVYRQRGAAALAARVLAKSIPTMEELFNHQPGLMEIVRRLALLPRGLILVTGPTGSGKSTTLAAMVDWINQQIDRHIITLEDPIEYLHKHGKSIVNQREVGEDVQNFAE